jgi:23S rRNA (guanine745-N1)-methyltransferase
MIGDVLRYLRCPVCASQLSQPDNVLRCPAGHSFDIARQGYVHLDPGRASHTGDTAEMVAARAEFLDAGHYAFISAALAEAAVLTTRPPPLKPTLTTRPPPLKPTSAYPRLDFVVDAGAGTGHHLAAVLDALPGAAGLALDVAKPALRRAARAHLRAAAALCDTWRHLPVADGTASLVLNVFAPRNGAEFHRVLRADGALLVVTPTAAHLAELIGWLGLLSVDAGKEDRVAASLAGRFDEAGEKRFERQLRLSHHEIATLVRMGPSAWHAEPTALADRISALPEPVLVTASILLRRYSPRV